MLFKLFAGLALFFNLVGSSSGQCPAVDTFSTGVVSNHFGESLASPGDVDGDGVQDILVGSPYAYNGDVQMGKAYLYSGQTGALLLEFSGIYAGGEFGSSVSGAGDYDGDGILDLLIGARYAATFAGRAYVFSGSDGHLLKELQAGYNAHFGQTVASVGDVNGDGKDDVIVGAPYFSDPLASAGLAVVYSGETGLSLHAFVGKAIGDHFGTAVSGAGDIDHDGYADIIVGVPNDDVGGENSGSVIVFSGKDGDTLYHVIGSSLYASFGETVAGGKDINSDGYPDIVIGEPYYNDPGLGEVTGRVFVYSGKDGHLLFVLSGSTDGGYHFGLSIAITDDANNDGFNDLLIGAPYRDGSNYRGRAFLHSGRDGELLYRWQNPTGFGYYANAVASVGQVTGNSFCNIVIAEYLWPNPPGGKVYYYQLGDWDHDGVDDACCCLGKRGNVNLLGVIDLSDLSVLVGYLTGSGYQLPCANAANVNGSGAVDLADLSALVSYLTAGGYVLPSCP
jgi:hypothetical protein